MQSVEGASHLYNSQNKVRPSEEPTAGTVFPPRHRRLRLPRIVITVEHAGKACLIVVVSFMAGVLAFVLWAALEKGAR